MGSKTAIVTGVHISPSGGAAGIGLAIVEYLAQSKHEIAHVTILDIDAPTGEVVLKSLGVKFPNFTFSFHLCDVASWEDQARAFSDVYAENGRINIVFANAGIAETGPLFTTTGDNPVKPDLKACDVDLFGAMYKSVFCSCLTRAFYISKNQPSASMGLKGSVICTASMAGLYPLSLVPIYSAAKYGVVGLVRGLAGQLRHEHIQINAVASVCQTNLGARLRLPGITFTPLTAVTRGVEMLLSDPVLNGKVAEISGDQIAFAEPPGVVDESMKNNLADLESLAERIWNGEVQRP
ncbi:hypothetical protein BJY00DRAFT_299900 [Aspergillus carlsbadensis]|nr:hypothetical protein BJY00DRAFT_299900 [Aspergillus carlsbadensis]